MMSGADSSAPSARDFCGWLLYLTLMMLVATTLPRAAFVPGDALFLFVLSFLGIWRYGLRIVHLVRAALFLYVSFPRARRRAQELGEDVAPPHVYLVVTSFRIATDTTAAVYLAAIDEAVRCGYPATIVASIVELSDEHLINALWQQRSPPSHVTLRIVRIPGTGKRDGLAQAFRAVSRDMPHPDAYVAVIDGDTVIGEGIVRNTAPYLRLFPNVGGLTTNEFCSVEGSYIMSEWHKLRFAQRHINMCSMALTHRVLTLTGRMSVFRAGVLTQPEFIADVEHDSISHWRLGRFKFLTGDDKSSWLSVVRMGYDTYYVPDAEIRTVEHPPDPRFVRASRQLMFRWSGNSLRQNTRAVKLGPGRLGWFTYYVLQDQRISMWASLVGLVLVGLACVRGEFGLLLAYIFWVLLTRLLMTLSLIPVGHRIGPLFPLLMYYNQIVGAWIKTEVVFRLDQQSWTRQNTRLKHNVDSFQRWFNRWSSPALRWASFSLFIALLMRLEQLGN